MLAKDCHSFKILHSPQSSLPASIKSMKYTCQRHHPNDQIRELIFSIKEMPISAEQHRHPPNIPNSTPLRRRKFTTDDHIQHLPHPQKPCVNPTPFFLEWRLR